MFSRSTPSRRAPEGGTRQLAGNALVLGDLHALVVKLEARMGLQERKIAVLEQENLELWQEIHRLKGPRLPLEIFFLIVGSARDDKKALKTFSLVSKSWMHITREILFARISLRGVKPLPFPNNPHCTIFPYVQVMNIGNETEDVGMQRVPNWLDDFNFFLHMPKFTALTSLDLESFDSLDFDTVIRAMPPAMKGRIQKLGIQRPGASMLAITSFISNFANLTTLEVGNIHGHWEADGLAPLLPTNEDSSR
ncbi:hypothetical protein B0H14DRAFT_3474771 [Mycena olivaceomarginata]|nr:hypothetical protein B0H14DRAFT_3474771 [Mycena olivaceomarginata]